MNDPVIVKIRQPYTNRHGVGICGQPWKRGGPNGMGQAMSTMAKKNGKPWSPNKYGGKCAGCHEWVPAGRGVRVGSPVRDDDGQQTGEWIWNVYC